MIKISERLKPDFYFEHYTKLTTNWLKQQNIHTVISDLDGTVAEDDKDGDERFSRWLKEMNEAGINIIIASNNKNDRVAKFIRTHRLVGYGECRKPFGTKLHRELLYKGLEQETCMFLGDQIFTDIWCGKRLGIKTCLVTPIPCEQPFRTKCKRGIEKILLRKWRMAQ